MNEKVLMESSWSESVSNDPKHHPQVFDRPSTTVRKEWCRRPQEAHIAEGTVYRRLSVSEISCIQSFPLDWVEVDGLTENEKIAVLGNAVPPLLSQFIAGVLKQEIHFSNQTLLEICAGIGGLSYGFDYLSPIAKIELWDVAAKVLRSNKPWPESCVVEGYAQDYDYSAVRGKVGLLCGGPPCQPWSQAGHQRGANDPRDVMGFTPVAIASCEPEAFLFENVPGLFSASEHREYVSDLLKRMGNPKDGLRYGVATIVLNAADYGVPQIRRRVFILGIRNKSNTFVHKVLTKIQNMATHHDPSKPAVGKMPWVTLRKAFENIPCTEPWIKWKVTEETLRRLQLWDESVSTANDALDVSLNDSYEYSDDQIEVLEADRGMLNNKAQYNQDNDLSYSIPRIELLWPGKNELLSYDRGIWLFSPMKNEYTRHALMYSETIGMDGNLLGYVIKGDYLNSLESLMPFVPASVQMVYFDSPRLSSLETEAKPGRAVSTWLSIVQNAAINSYKSLKETGFFILQTDEEMSHYGRQVLDEVFGRLHHVTTFAWQKKYAPQNDKTKNNPTDAFDYIIVYSKCTLDDLPKVGMLVKPDDVIDDGDWRGCYTAGHKGAKSGNETTKFHVNAPPYHWEILDSCLPEGKFWFDGMTGVLWFQSVHKPGNYWIDLRCTDADGNNDHRKVSFSVKSQDSYNEHFVMPERVWWLLKNDNDIVSGGELKISDEIIPCAIEGEPYSVVFRAMGGKPFTMASSAPGSNRYWEFSLNTLVEKIVTASAWFGKKGTALPSGKNFLDRENVLKRMAVMNWLPWQDYGKSEDASRHVKKLLAAGLTSGTMNLTAKPQLLLSHIINLFAPKESDLIVALGDLNAAMSSVALKMNRRFIHITGSSDQDEEIWEKTAKKRLLAVINGNDVGDVEKDDPMPEEYHVSQGQIDVLKVSCMSITSDNATGAIMLSNSDENIVDFYAGLVGSYRRNSEDNSFIGIDGRKVIVFDSEEVLDSGMMSYIASQHVKEKITIIAERLELPDNVPLPQNVSVLHAPFDLVRR